MTFNVDVYVDDVWVKTYYNVPADDAPAAEEYVRENLLQVDFSTEEND